MTPAVKSVVMAQTCLSFTLIANLYDINLYLSTAHILTAVQSEYYHNKHDGHSKTEFEKVPVTGG
jgi:hypothetical protein